MSRSHLISKPLKALLSQRIKALYEQQLQHQLDEINFKLSEKNLIIIMEGTLTKPEQILVERDRVELAQQMRTVLNKVIQPQIRQVIEEVMDVTVVDFLSDTTTETGRTGAIAVFGFKPNPKALSLVNLKEGSSAKN